MEHKPKRWITLDIFKVMAIFMMTIGHTLVWMASSDDQELNPVSGGWLFFMTEILPYFGVIPNCIPFGVGLATRFMLSDYWEKFNQIPLNKVFKRSAILFTLGCLLNLITWGPQETFAWDVLHFASLSLVVLSLILKTMGLKILYLFGIFVLLSAEYLRDIVLTNPQYYQNKFWIILLGDYEGANFWPFFPWFFYIVLGIFIANIFLKKDEKKTSLILISAGTATILFLNLLGYKLKMKLNPADFWGSDLMMPPLSIVIATLAGILVLFGLLVNLKIKNPNTIKKIQAISNQITLFYFTHTFFIFHLTKIMKEYFSLTFFSYMVFCGVQLLFFYWFLPLVDTNLKYKHLLSINKKK